MISFLNSQLWNGLYCLGLLACESDDIAVCIRFNVARRTGSPSRIASIVCWLNPVRRISSRIPRLAISSPKLGSAATLPDGTYSIGLNVKRLRSSPGPQRLSVSLPTQRSCPALMKARFSRPRVFALQGAPSGRATSTQDIEHIVSECTRGALDGRREEALGRNTRGP